MTDEKRVVRIDKYILDASGKPVPEPDLHKWAAWIERRERSVADERIGESRICTVFLALDHKFCDSGPPILWETMVFGGPLNQETARCAGSREQAEAMHAEMVERVKAQNISSPSPRPSPPGE